MSKQNYFNLLPTAYYSETDFIVSEANKEAVDQLTFWPHELKQNKIPGIILYGSEHSGKTHLCHIWKHKTNAVFIQSMHDFLKSKEYNCYIIENINQLINQNEEDLLHLLNSLTENKRYFLLTSQISPAVINIKLADLASRIKAIHNIEIKQPDEQLLKALMIKYFAERQLKIDLHVIDYLLMRIERSCGAVRHIIDLIDSHSLAEKRNITVKFVHHILNNVL